jgi:protein subunit release factor B
MNAYIQVKCDVITPENIQNVRMSSRHILQASEENGFMVQIIDEDRYGPALDWVNITIKISGNNAHEFFLNYSKIQPQLSILINLFPEVINSSVSIQDRDVIIEFFRNKSVIENSFVHHTDSCVKITHNPSGVIVSCQEYRSRHKNLAEAKTLLISKLTAININSG